MLILRKVGCLRGGAVAAVGVLLALTGWGCGQPQALIGPLPEDPRGGTATERDAAAYYASGLDHAWRREVGQALQDLQIANRLAPDQPLILSAIGFALDDLAHPEDSEGGRLFYNGLPTQGPLRREELDAEAFAYLSRSAELNCDDERVYERLAAHWFRVSKRPAEPGEPASAAAARRRAEHLSAYNSFLALQHLALDSSAEGARQKAMVYITHLRKYFQEHGQLQEELALVRIHQRLEPLEVKLQVEEIELLYLVREVAAAQAALTRLMAQLEGSPQLPQLQRRIRGLRVLGRRVEAALRVSGWPHHTGEAEATAASPQLRWLQDPVVGMDLLWERFWRDFSRETQVSPLGPIR